MTRLFQSKLFWIIALLSMVVLVLNRRSSPPQRSVAKSVVVECAHLPRHVRVGDNLITLTSVNRVGEQAIVEISVEPGSGKQVTKPVCRARIGRMSVETAAQFWSTIGKKVNYRAQFDIPRHSESMELSCMLQSYISAGSKKLVFHNISASSLPITQKTGPVSTTLLKAYYGNSTGKFFPFRQDGRSKFFVIVYSQDGPPDNLSAYFQVLPDGYRIESKSLDPYWVTHAASVTSDTGVMIPSAGSITYEANGARDVFTREAEKRTTVESLVSAISRSKASDMITNRAMRVARNHPRRFSTALFLMSITMPRRFTWQSQIPLPPKDRQDISVIFKHVVIP